MYQPFSSLRYYFGNPTVWARTILWSLLSRIAFASAFRSMGPHTTVAIPSEAQKR